MEISIDIIFNIILYCDIDSIYNLCISFVYIKYVIIKYQHQIFNKLMISHFDKESIALFDNYNGTSIDKYFKIYIYNTEKLIENDNYILNFKYIQNYINILKMFNKLCIFKEIVNNKEYIIKIYDCMIYHQNFYNRNDLNKNLFLKIQNILLSIDCTFNIHIFIKSILAYDKKSFRFMLQKNKNVIYYTHDNMPILFYIKYSLVELKKYIYVSKKVESFIDSVINILRKNGAIDVWYYNNNYWTVNTFYKYLLDLNKESLKSIKLYELID